MKRVGITLMAVCLMATLMLATAHSGLAQTKEKAAKLPEKKAAKAEKAAGMPMRKPGAEEKRIGYFVGHWKGEGEMKPTLFGPGGKFTSTEHAEWLPGGFYVAFHSEGNGPMGEEKGLAIMGYDPEEKVYTYYFAGSMGMAFLSKGTVKGDTWTWLSEGKMGGKPFKARFTIKENGPDSYSFTEGMMGADGKWSTTGQGKSTKTK